MSASDTSSEENLELLREAADGQFINDSMFASGGTGDTDKEYNGITKQEKPLSLRPQMNKEQQHNELRVTPEFQAFVAKHLVRIIDRQLEEFQGDLSSSLVQNGDAKGQPDGGIQLFASSSSYLSVDTVPSYKKGKRQVAQEEDEDELEKCRAVAVSPQWVMSGKGTSGWEKCGKEVLVVNSNGEVIAHEGAKMKIKTNSWGARDSSFHIDVKSSALDLSLKQREKCRQKRKKEKEKKKLKKIKNGDMLKQEC